MTGVSCMLTSVVDQKFVEVAEFVEVIDSGNDLPLVEDLVAIFLFS